MNIEEIREKNAYYKRLVDELNMDVDTVEVDEDEIRFRCSSLGHLMTDPKGKSNYDKWSDACMLLVKTQSSYDNLKTKDGKMGTGYLAKISELNKLIPELEKVKHEKELSETVITHLVDVYVSREYNRFTEIKAKVLDKGNEVEEDSITVVSRITKKFYKKNEEHLKNSYIQGTPDLFDGVIIQQAEEIRDTKSSWDAFTFHRSKYKPLDKRYYWQMQGYMALSVAKVSYVDFCLINTPYHLVQAELRRESYNHLNEETPTWIELQIIANHVYDKETFDKYIHNRGIVINALEGKEQENAKAVYHGFVEIPLEKRHFPFEVKRNDEDIERLYQRIEDCRKWMKQNLYK